MKIDPTMEKLVRAGFHEGFWFCCNDSIHHGKPTPKEIEVAIINFLSTFEAETPVMIQEIPIVERPTGRKIPDLTKREHICEWQSSVRQKMSQDHPDDVNLRVGFEALTRLYKKAKDELKTQADLVGWILYIARQIDRTSVNAADEFSEWVNKLHDALPLLDSARATPSKPAAAIECPACKTQDQGFVAQVMRNQEQSAATAVGVSK